MWCEARAANGFKGMSVYNGKGKRNICRGESGGGLQGFTLYFSQLWCTCPYLVIDCEHFEEHHRGFKVTFGQTATSERLRHHSVSVLPTLITAVFLVSSAGTHLLVAFVTKN